MKRAVSTSRATARIAAISDLLRLRMCSCLQEQELTVGELARVLQTPQSSTSRHLKVLSDAGWLARRADGTATLYQLDLDAAPDQRLWHAVADQLAHDTADQLAEDRRRLAAVLAERRVDSLDFFGRLAGDWDHVRQDLFGHTFGLHAMLGLLPHDWVVADIGCGTGVNTSAIAPHVREVICIDQSQPMLDAARVRLADHPNVRFEQAPLEALPLPDASVDAALCLLVLHFLDEPLEGLREVRRVLRPRAPRAGHQAQGVALVVDMYPHERSEYRHTMGHKHQGFAPDRLEDLCREAGFDDIRITPLPADPAAKGPGLYGVTAR